MSCLGLVLAGEANVSVSGGERLGLELLRLVPIPVVHTTTITISIIIIIIIIIYVLFFPSFTAFYMHICQSGG